MDFTIRNAVMKDYESVVKIMNQVQQMHVNWRPDLYKLNTSIIPINIFAKIVENDTFFVAEADGIVVGIMEIIFRHIETPSHITRDVIFIDSMAAYEMYSKYGFTVKSINMELL